MHFTAPGVQQVDIRMNISNVEYNLKTTENLGNIEAMIDKQRDRWQDSTRIRMLLKTNRYFHLQPKLLLQDFSTQLLNKISFNDAVKIFSWG